MMRVLPFVLPAIALLCLVAGCGGNGEAEKANGENGKKAHEEEGKHGGHLEPLGDDEAHVEMKVDHAAGTVQLWIYDGDVNKCAADEAPVLNAKYASGLVRLTATAGGEDCDWLIRDDALKAEPEQARFLLKIGGKTYTPELVHED